LGGPSGPRAVGSHSLDPLTTTFYGSVHRRPRGPVHLAVKPIINP
jgi:hypothetical protein